MISGLRSADGATAITFSIGCGGAISGCETGSGTTTFLTGSGLIIGFGSFLIGSGFGGSGISIGGKGSITAAGAGASGCCNSIFNTSGFSSFSIEKSKDGTTITTNACSNIEALMAQIMA